MFIIIVLWLGSDRPSGLLFLPALLLSILAPLFLPYSSVSLFPIAILNGTLIRFSRNDMIEMVEQAPVKN